MAARARVASARAVFQQCNREDDSRVPLSRALPFDGRGALEGHPAGGVRAFRTPAPSGGPRSSVQETPTETPHVCNKGRKTLLVIMYYILLEGAAGNVGQQDQYRGGLQGGEGSRMLLLFSGAAYTQLVNLYSINSWLLACRLSVSRHS